MIGILPNVNNFYLLLGFARKLVRPYCSTKKLRLAAANRMKY